MEKDGVSRGAVLITGAAGGMGNAAAKVAEAVFTVMKKRRPPAVKNLNRNPVERNSTYTQFYEIL